MIEKQTLFNTENIVYLVIYSGLINILLRHGVITIAGYLQQSIPHRRLSTPCSDHFNRSLHPSCPLRPLLPPNTNSAARKRSLSVPGESIEHARRLVFDGQNLHYSICLISRCGLMLLCSTAIEHERKGDLVHTENFFPHRYECFRYFICFIELRSRLLSNSGGAGPPNNDQRPNLRTAVGATGNARTDTARTDSTTVGDTQRVDFRYATLADGFVPSTVPNGRKQDPYEPYEKKSRGQKKAENPHKCFACFFHKFAPGLHNECRLARRKWEFVRGLLRSPHVLGWHTEQQHLGVVQLDYLRRAAARAALVSTHDEEASIWRECFVMLHPEFLPFEEMLNPYILDPLLDGCSNPREMSQQLLAAASLPRTLRLPATSVYMEVNAGPEPEEEDIELSDAPPNPHFDAPSASDHPFGFALQPFDLNYHQTSAVHQPDIRLPRTEYDTHDHRARPADLSSNPEEQIFYTNLTQPHLRGPRDLTEDLHCAMFNHRPPANPTALFPRSTTSTLSEPVSDSSLRTPSHGPARGHRSFGNGGVGVMQSLSTTYTSRINRPAAGIPEIRTSGQRQARPRNPGQTVDHASMQSHQVSSTENMYLQQSHSNRTTAQQRPAMPSRGFAHTHSAHLHPHNNIASSFNWPRPRYNSSPTSPLSSGSAVSVGVYSGDGDITPYSLSQQQTPPSLPRSRNVRAPSDAHSMPSLINTSGPSTGSRQRRPSQNDGWPGLQTPLTPLTTPLRIEPPAGDGEHKPSSEEDLSSIGSGIISASRAAEEYVQKNPGLRLIDDDEFEILPETDDDV